MEGIYYFGEHLRWNLGFSNPNIAGAFIAVLIAFLSPITAVWPKMQICQICIYPMFWRGTYTLVLVGQDILAWSVCCGCNVYVGLQCFLPVMQGIQKK